MILESRCAERCANDAFLTSFRATLMDTPYSENGQKMRHDCPALSFAPVSPPPPRGAKDLIIKRITFYLWWVTDATLHSSVTSLSTPMSRHWNYTKTAQLFWVAREKSQVKYLSKALVKRKWMFCLIILCCTEEAGPWPRQTLVRIDIQRADQKSSKRIVTASCHT